MEKIRCFVLQVKSCVKCKEGMYYINIIDLNSWFAPVVTAAGHVGVENTTKKNSQIVT